MLNRDTGQGSSVSIYPIQGQTHRANVDPQDRVLCLAPGPNLEHGGRTSTFVRHVFTQHEPFPLARVAHEGLKRDRLIDARLRQSAYVGEMRRHQAETFEALGVGTTPTTCKLVQGQQIKRKIYQVWLRTMLLDRGHRTRKTLMSLCIHDTHFPI